MSWHPNDLVADADLVDYEAAILTRFGQTSWTGKRTKALEDWLFPALRVRGFDPQKLRTRFEPESALGFTASVYADLTGVAKSATDDDIALASVFATPANDALYVANLAQFRGLFWRLLDTASAVTATMTVKYWNGAWTALALTDGTVHTLGKALSGGGSVIWTLPTDWVPRLVNGVGPFYWIRASVSATPTGATCSQIAPIRSSVLRAPVCLRTLALIMREAPTGAPGPWLEKAQYYQDEADKALADALTICGGEFDTDGNDLIGDGEAAQTAEEVSDGFFLMERY